uniref:NADH-ubiquinone oxidoreductase chain 1 n=1 Tax=Bugula neritina TaxID=10212 RepID=A9UKA6_BUGNE|nr:NADH dehydrogenase subunit 1 [Bugula neritina]AAT79564.1 NADH dehydrogenase subunit 1 [Bugula neritina]
MMMISTLIKSLTLFLCLALSVGFYTLVERKVLSYAQLRKGPNKAGFLGIPQPLADAMKLFTKETTKIQKSMFILYNISPVLATSIMFITWMLYNTPANQNTIIKLSIMLFIVISSLNVYTIMLSGWASNSKYALLGAIRAVAQTISYEISMALLIMSILLISLNFNMEKTSISQMPTLWMMFILPLIFSAWMITMLAETNRSPFDLAEGESELVSGFNIEYGSGEFALLFIAEYGSILFVTVLTATLMLKGSFNTINLTQMVKIMTLAFTFLWVRATFPRMRYDALMSLTWKTFLTLTICSVTMLITHNNI